VKERNRVYCSAKEHRMNKEEDHNNYLHFKKIFDIYAGAEQMA
jgi:hypothetical protein